MKRMSMTIMTPEEVMRLGKRIVLFPKSKIKGREIYFIEDGRLTKKGMLWTDGERFEVELKDQSSYIEDIYPYIEMVYSQKRKGILLARRAGNLESNQRHQLPLRNTPKGMNARLKRNQKVDPREQMEPIQRVVEKRQKQRFYQEQHG